jgi:predicted RNA binding protein YcfA (HicA-like mRNA interferase family)
VKAVSGKRKCKVLERKGWARKRIQGSHHIYAHDDHPEIIISVPVHANRSLKRGLQHGIMKDAELSQDDL